MNDDNESNVRNIMSMSAITISVPEYLRRLAEKLAEREKVSVDRVVSLALAGYLTSQLEENLMEDLAEEGGWEKFKTAFYSRQPLEPPALTGR